MSGEPLPPAPDVPVMWLPGAASIQPAALYDAIYQLTKRLKWVEYVMAEGTGSLPPPEYLTEDEAAAFFVPLTHLADANPHAQYLQQPAVQALVDAAVAAHVAQADPHPTYLNVARADARYLPITYSPPPTDLSNYYTKAQADTAFLTQAEGDLLYQPIGTGGISQADADLRYVNTAGDTMTGILTAPEVHTLGATNQLVVGDRNGGPGFLFYANAGISSSTTAPATPPCSPLMTRGRYRFPGGRLWGGGDGQHHWREVPAHRGRAVRPATRQRRGL